MHTVKFVCGLAGCSYVHRMTVAIGHPLHGIAEVDLSGPIAADIKSKFDEITFKSFPNFSMTRTRILRHLQLRWVSRLRRRDPALSLGGPASGFARESLSDRQQGGLIHGLDEGLMRA